MKINILVATAALLLCTSTSFADQHVAWPAPEGASVYFINLENGATVTSPVLIQMGLSGMGVAPAGTERESTGHHHLLIDRVPMGEGEDDEWLYGLPSDEHHRHFGAGQTELMLELDPGTHTLQLVLGDMNHVPFGEQMVSDVVTITVE